MNFNINIVSGEKLQEIANVYLGIDNDFINNPYINNQTNKHKNMLEINTYYNNPKIVFCYGHRITILAEKIKYFTNEFILITHNSDKNILDNNIYIKTIYNYNKLVKWYSQNLCFDHNKLFFLPIGIANNQWEHGYKFTNFYNTLSNKTQLNKKLKRKKKQVYQNVWIETTIYLIMIHVFMLVSNFTFLDFGIFEKIFQ